MSEGKKKSSTKIITLFVIILVALGVSAGIFAQKNHQTIALKAAEEKLEQINQDFDNGATEEAKEDVKSDEATQTPDQDNAVEEKQQDSAEASSADSAVKSEEEKVIAVDAQATSAMIQPRILGDVNSPLEIREHSSFTCSHCKHFHETNFKNIKQDYIDTGKAHIIFDDFPRNKVDLTAGVIARCVPEKAYFNFVQLLFETQDDWAFGDKYVDYLRQNAKLVGLNDAEIDACLNNKELQEGLAKNAQMAAEQHSVNSTPTLVLNNKKVVPGLLSYDELKAEFEKQLSDKTE